MLRVRNTIFIILCAALVAVSAAFFYLIPKQIQPDTIEKSLVPYIEDGLSGRLTFDEFQIKTFPQISVEMVAPEFRFYEKAGSSLKADRVVLHLSLLHALIGKAKPSSVEIYGGETSYLLPLSSPLKRLDLHQMDLKVSALHGQSPMKFEVSSGLLGTPQVVSGRGLVMIDETDGVSFVNGNFDIAPFELTRLEQQLRRDFPLRFDQGTLQGNLSISKETTEPWIHMGIQFQSEKTVYRMPDVSSVLQSPAFSSTMNFDFRMNPKNNEVLLDSASIDSPVGLITGNGRFLTETGEIHNMRMTVNRLSMELIPHYFIPFNRAVPFNLGFSGLSDLEMSMEGTLEHLTIHANWDLSPSLLTYGRYFTKPRDLPLNISSDLLLKGGTLLSGDFSLRLKEATLKGTIKGMDVRTSNGQLNIITNKFDIQDWEPLLPPLMNYDLGGDLKILVDFDGNLSRLAESKRGFNLTLENGWLSRGDDVGVQNANLSMDFSDVAFKIKNAKFDFGDSEVDGQITIYSLSKNPNARFEIKSGQMQIDKAMRTFLVLSEGWLGDEFRASVQNFSNRLTPYLPKTEPVEDLLVKGEVKDRQWEFSELSFGAYGGDVQAKASVDGSLDVPLYWINVEANRLSMARYKAQADASEKLMDGNLFLKMSISGQRDKAHVSDAEAFSARGEVKVTNGEFHTFDLISRIAEVDELSALSVLSTRTTPFDDLQFSFDTRDGKWLTNNLVMLTPDLLVEGQGELHSVTGMNLRMDSFLSSSLTRQILEPKISRYPWKGSERFGPISMILTGPLENPGVQMEKLALTQLIDDIVQQNTHRVLRSFLPEDLLFDEGSQS